MIIDALIPVKAAAAGKERLSALLSPGERAELVQVMLRDVAGALLASGLLRRVAVTSPDTEMLALAASLGALPLPEPPGTRGLNAALAAAITRLTVDGAASVLIVQGDVPEIGEGDVAALAKVDDAAAPLVRAVPSADGGTSALLLVPPGVIAPAFGPDSFTRHREAALAAAGTFEPLRLDTLTFDIDRPEDVERVLRSNRAAHTRRALVRAGVPVRLGLAASSCNEQRSVHP